MSAGEPGGKLVGRVSFQPTGSLANLAKLPVALVTRGGLGLDRRAGDE